MLYIIIGFAFGFTIPYIARRFAKIMLQTPTLAYALYHILKINKRVSKQKRLSNHKYIQTLLISEGICEWYNSILEDEPNNENVRMIITNLKPLHSNMVGSFFNNLS